MKNNVIGIEISPKGAKKPSVRPTEPGTRKNGQTISVKVTAEAEGVLVIETLEGADETYRLCPNRKTSWSARELQQRPCFSAKGSPGAV